MKTNKKGFTLVEVVVVMAIIGVLAAILVPTLMGYIRKAKLKTSNASAKVAYNVLTGTVGKYICDGEENTIKCVGMTIDCTGNGPLPDNAFTREIYNSITQNGEGSGIMYIGEFETSNGEKAYFVHWVVKEGDEMVGQYPDPAYDINEVPEYKTFKPAK